MSFEPLAPPAASEPAISVALVEDEAGTRERLVRALGQASRLFLAHAAGTGQALLDWLKATNQPFNAAKVQQAAGQSTWPQHVNLHLPRPPARSWA